MDCSLLRSEVDVNCGKFLDKEPTHSEKLEVSVLYPVRSKDSRNSLLHGRGATIFSWRVPHNIGIPLNISALN